MSVRSGACYSRAVRRVAWTLGIALIACGDSSGSGERVGSSASHEPERRKSGADSSEVEGQSEPPAGAPYVNRNPGVTPRTRGKLETNFELSISGEGGVRVGRVEVTHNTGQIEVHGKKHRVLAYYKTPVQEGRDVFQAVAVSPTAWYIVWFYCLDGQLVDMFLQGTDGTTMRPDTGTGTCEVGPGPVVVDVDLPEHELAWPSTPDVAAFSVNGEGVTINDGVGTIDVNGTPFAFAAMTGLDCRDGARCGSSRPGWWELHGMMRNRETDETCFTIGYLTPSRPGRVSFQYTLCLPSLTQPHPSFAASFTVPEKRR